MRTPCVMYFTKSSSSFAETFDGRTSRNERVFGRISQHYLADPAKITLNIDGLEIDTPDNLEYVEARQWVIKEIESLGYHVVEM